MVLTQVLTTYYIGIRPLPIRKCMNIVLHVQCLNNDHFKVKYQCLNSVME